ncbi:sigma-70 family RNA polymerase sigma factor [Anaerotignum sp.]|nr:sigma-70 family RNA polymerase sigma factor [Anaerotignum sp.]MBQ7759307.1 sigma-70 family RNA polymerase sigma factor [Anaerotignum sp.]
MTNEELVMVIKGGNQELTPSLWERVERFAHAKAADYYYLHSELCARAGVTLDDLKQESYFAFMAAVNYYDPDKGFLFLSFMTYPLQNVFNALCGVRTQQGRKEPLNNAKSLSTPVGEEESTLEDLLEDETAADDLQRIEDMDYTKRLRSDLEGCIDTLNADQAYTIRGRYFGGMTIRQIAERHGITEGLCRGREAEALRHLRRGKNREKLKVYQDDIISRCGYRGSFSMWRNSGCSAVEYTVLKREKAAERWAY